MRILGIVIAILAFLFGLRYLATALQTLLRGKILVRQGLRSHWQVAPETSLIWKTALRHAVMGALLVVLGLTLIT